MKAINIIGPRVAGTLVCGVLLIVLGTTLFNWWAVGSLRLQPLLVVVVSAGFRLPFLPGAALVFFLGYLSDVFSGGVIGLQVAVYMIVFVACALAQLKLEINSWPFQMAAVGLMSLVFQLLLVGGLSLVHRQYLSPPNPGLAGAQALLSALTAPLFFTGLEGLVRLSVRFWPKERSATS